MTKENRTEGYEGRTEDRPKPRPGNSTAVLAFKVIDANVENIREKAEDAGQAAIKGLHELVEDYAGGMARTKGRMCRDQSAGGLAAGFLPDDIKGLKANLGVTDAAFKVKISDIRAHFNQAMDALEAANESAMEQIGGEKGAITGPIMNVGHRQAEQ